MQGLDVGDLGLGVLGLRHDVDARDLPAGVTGLEVERGGIAAGRLRPTHRRQLGIEVHPPVGRVEVEAQRRNPGPIDADRGQVDAIAARAAPQALVTIRLGQQDAVVEPARQGEVDAQLAALVGLLEAEIAGIGEVRGDVLLVHFAVVAEGADPRAQAAIVLSRQHAHALPPGADLAVDQAVRARGDRRGQRACIVEPIHRDAHREHVGAGVAGVDRAADFGLQVDEVVGVETDHRA